MCTQPLIGWKKKFSSLTDRAEKYYADKKVKFKQPADWWNYDTIHISCGCCTECVLNHANSWATRCYMESLLHKENCFITLTYSNKYLPIQNRHMTLKEKDVQDFIKRLRYHIGDETLLYFYCGEYGPKTHRPHYHILIMGWKPKDLKIKGISKTEQEMYTSKQLEKIWGKGFVTIEDFNYKTACYTARYCQKKAGLKKTKRIYTGEFEKIEKIDERNGKKFIINKNFLKTCRFDNYGREKEFIRMSKKPAIGLRYWELNKEKIKRNEGILININGSVVLKPIPRYFKKLWEKENLEEYLAYEYRQKQKQEQKKNELPKILTTQKKYLDDKLLVDNLEKKLNEINDKNIIFKANLLKRSQI